MPRGAVIGLAPPSEAQPQIGRSELSEAEAQSDRGSDVVALEKAEGQSVVHLREHDPGIDIPFGRKPPIDSGRDRVECPGALRVLGAEAGGRPPGGGAEVGVLDIMVIGADHIQIFGNSVLGPDPHDLESLVTEAVHAEGGIVDVRVVERVAALTKKASARSAKAVCGSLGARYRICSYPPYTFSGPFVYLATSITASLSEIVAVSVCGRNGGIGTPLALLLPGRTAQDPETLAWLYIGATDSAPL